MAKQRDSDGVKRRGRDSNPRYRCYQYDGLANRPHDAISNEDSKSYDEEDAAMSSCMSFLRQYDEDLARFVASWPGLPEHIRQAIVTLVESVATSNSANG